MIPADVFAIDQKIDDGSYTASNTAIDGTTGRIRAFDPSGNTTNCVDVSTGAYSITTGTPTCMAGCESDSQVGPMKYFGTVASTGIGAGGNSGGIVTTAPLPFALPGGFTSMLYNEG